MGSLVKLEIGGHTGWREGGSIDVEGKVIYAGRGKYVATGPMRVNQEVDHSPTAILDVDGIWLQLVTYKTSLIDEDPIIQFARASSSPNRRPTSGPSTRRWGRR